MNFLRNFILVPGLFFFAGALLAWFALSGQPGAAAPEAAASRAVRVAPTAERPVPAIETVDLSDTAQEIVWTWM